MDLDVKDTQTRELSTHANDLCPCIIITSDRHLS